MDVGLIEHLESSITTYYYNKKTPCKKRFWSNYYGSSLVPKILRFLAWHRVKCGSTYYFEGVALCNECKKTQTHEAHKS